jgi:hypothetical protein
VRNCFPASGCNTLQFGTETSSTKIHLVGFG